MKFINNKLLIKIIIIILPRYGLIIIGTALKKLIVRRIRSV